MPKICAPIVIIIIIIIIIGLRADFLVHFMARALQPEEAEETESEVSQSVVHNTLSPFVSPRSASLSSQW